MATQAAQPLVGATVEVLDSEGKPIANSSTDSDGKFKIVTDVPAGEYELIITHGGELNAQQVNLASSEVSVKIIVTTSGENEPGETRYAVSARQLGLPDKTRARLTAAQKEFEKGRLDRAMEQVHAAMKMTPFCSEVWSMRAFMKLSDRNVAGAISDASQAVDLDQTNPEAYLALGSAYNAEKDFDRAETYLRRSLELRPDSWQSRLELAKAWYGQKRFVLALRQLDRVQQDFPDVHLVRANVLISLGRKQEGAEEFSIFLGMVPSDRRAPQIRRIIAEIARSESALSYPTPF